MKVPIKDIEELHELPNDTEIARIKGWKLARMKEGGWRLLDEEGNSKDSSPDLDGLVDRWKIRIAPTTKICPI